MVGVQIADKRMGLDEAELLLSGGTCQQSFEFLEPPTAVRERHLAGLIEFGAWLFLGQ